TVANAGSGDGIDITAGGGDGILVSNTGIGVFALNSVIPLLGEAPSTGAYGVLGTAANDSDFEPAIFGIQGGSTHRTIGVEGFTESASGAGVWGIEVGTSTVGAGFTENAGVWGDTNQSFGVSVFGTTDDGFPLAGYNNSPSGFTTLFADNLENTNSTR